MQDNVILRLVYTFFLGLLLAMFVGVGINTFYPGPQQPEYPVELYNYNNKELTTEQAAKQRMFDVQMQQYNEQMKPYNRNVSIIALIAAVILLGVSLLYEKRIKVIGDGVLLGGLFSLLYSIGRGFASENSKYVFVVLTVGLLVSLYLGYHRFVQPRKPESLPAKP